ncbi:hypothetical protein BJ944DRAFT_271233 [Cunninghamella echinulata]|nr:hypothetical protein BJ944DRAFT_271233 [Cunninghamella echinulata]
MDYSNHLAPNEPAFWRICEGDTCHCDFRLTITHCIEADALKIIYIITIIWSIINAIILLGYTFHRVVYKNQQLFDFTGRLPRPKPIETMCLFGALFNITRLIDVIIILSDTGVNGIIRSFFFELPWLFAMGGLSSYFFGVFHTLANSSKTISKSWIRSQFILDLICIVMLCAPLFTTLPISFVAGYFSEIGDYQKASDWTNAMYFIWTGHDFLMGTSVLLAGIRLLRLLKHHLLAQGDRQDNIVKIQLGVAKAKIIIFIACSCLWGYGTFIGYYAASRYAVMHNFGSTIVLACLTLYMGPLTCSIVIAALFLNIKMLNGFSNLSLGSSSNQKTPGNSGLDTSQKYTDQLSNSKSQNDQPIAFQLEHWRNFCQTATQNDDVDQNLERVDKKSTDSYFQQQQQNQNQQQLGYALSTFPEQYQHQTIKSPNHHHYSSTSSSNITIDHHITNKDPFNMSKVEEDQFHYNAMTNQIRSAPPPHRHSPTSMDENDSQVSSFIYNGNNISASNLVSSTRVEDKL